MTILCILASGIATAALATCIAVVFHAIKCERRLTILEIQLARMERP